MNPVVHQDMRILGKFWNDGEEEATSSPLDDHWTGNDNAADDYIDKISEKKVKEIQKAR